jgi:hypothetical protein
MAQLSDVMYYLLSSYPENYSGDLSNARLTKMVYLADWHSSINRGCQITDVDWYFDNFGPFVWDIKKTADSNPNLFEVESATNYYGGKKNLFSHVPGYSPNLTADELNSLDHIIRVTKDLTWDRFIKLVYGTFPIASTDRYQNLDLVGKAKEYQEGKAA